MQGAKVTPCRECGEGCFWVKSPKGKAMLMDVEPTRYGKWVLEPATDDQGRAGYKAEKASPSYTGDRYTCHWDTCRDKDKPRGNR